MGLNELRSNAGTSTRRDCLLRYSVNRSAARWVGLVTAVLLTLPALSHHSNAMFDQDKTVTLHGRVSQSQLSTPHCWVDRDVLGATGSEVWSIQMGPPGTLYRDGWRPTVLHAGD